MKSFDKLRLAMGMIVLGVALSAYGLLDFYPSRSGAVYYDQTARLQVSVGAALIAAGCLLYRRNRA